MTAHATAEKRLIPAWFRRTLLWGTAGLVVILAIALVSWLYSSRNARVRLEEVIAKLDHTDPNWRLEDLDKDVAPLPDDKNNALIVKQIIEQRPANWPSVDVQDKASPPGPQTQLDPAQALLLKKELERSPSTIALVRKLAGVPRGYLKIAWAPDGISSVLTPVQQTREVATIAKFDALLRAQEQDFDGALESCQAILMAGRSSDPGNTMIHALVRFAIQSVSINAVERTPLAQGEPSEAALATMQSLPRRRAGNPSSFRPSAANEPRLIASSSSHSRMTTARSSC